ncbi:GntR family transcriptional regulator [Thermomonospora amylolytica]|uniref:GntR family transcriptional regulator n=1 Tax=Thermomonospora amylolytica TaxID=1411117 RepID=UPI002278E5FB|nr:GntR family transcriptional regulator [Thermomonospora amylolytica]
MTIRDEIVRAIQVGQIPPGSPLPSNSQIQQRWNVSHKTSRRVLQELAAIGWAKRDSTRGYIAVLGPPLVLSHVPGHDPDQTDIDRTRDDYGQTPAYPPAYQTGQQTAPYAGPAPQAPPYAQPRPQHTVPLGGMIPPDLTRPARIHVSSETAPRHVAAALGMPDPFARVLVRRCVFTDPRHANPVELRTTYLPDLDPTGPLAEVLEQPDPWASDLARHVLRTPFIGTSDIYARPADTYETAALHLAPPALVLVRATTTYDESRSPIEHTVSVWPAESTRITATAHRIEPTTG